jgi:hypothetical protein
MSLINRGWQVKEPSCPLCKASFDFITRQDVSLSGKLDESVVVVGKKATESSTRSQRSAMLVSLVSDKMRLPDKGLLFYWRVLPPNFFLCCLHKMCELVTSLLIIMTALSVSFYMWNAKNMFVRKPFFYDLQKSSAWLYMYACTQDHVCIQCGNSDSESLLMRCGTCGNRAIHQFCMDPPSPPPWFCPRCTHGHQR